MSTKKVGVDVWWDHDKQKFRPKKLDLIKVPIGFRCPICGKVVVKTKYGVPRDNGKRVDQHRVSKGNWIRVEWEDYSIPIELTDPFTGRRGMCEDCWCDGFGTDEIGINHKMKALKESIEP